ncbi:MAG: hypothetical protein IPK78_20360 [Rhodospirillales bacterium]|nr:hypothetical protein [Rhodospirillales bacterium]
MKSELPQIVEALIELKGIIDKSAPLKILNLLAGNWIDSNAIGPIDTVAQAPAEHRALAINAQSTEIWRMYVQRAHGLPDEGLPMMLSLVDSCAESPTHEIVEQLVVDLARKFNDDTADLAQGNRI